MAQTVEQIQTSIIATLVQAAAAVGITIVPSEWSDYDYRQLLTFISAADNGILQQLWDAYRVDVEKLISSAAPQTAAWIQNFCLNIFQYDALSPQIVQFDAVNTAPYYPTVDPTKRIITQCAVVPSAPGVLNNLIVKTAKSGPVELSAGELSALQSALNTIDVPGVNIIGISSNSDKIFSAVDVTYVGQYSAVIQSTVIAAITAYYLSIPFNGVVSMDDLIKAIKSVPGVIAVVLHNVNGRADSLAYTPGNNNLVSNNTWLQNDYQTVSGYCVPETTGGSTFTDPRADDPTINNLNLIPV